MEDFDVTIVGAGPAGVACAISLIPSGLKVLVLEKEVFPRDKICGDALSGDVIKQLRQFYPAVFEDLPDMQNANPSYGLKIFSPDDNILEIDFKNNGKTAPGYICKRLDFDNFLFKKLLEMKTDNYLVKQGFKIIDIQPGRDHILIKGEEKSYRTKIIVGADGFKSIVKRSFLSSNIEKKHFCAGIRTYMKNIKGLSPKNLIELHFLSEILPGYFWIFPLPDNTANVGLGVLSKEVSERKMNLKEIFNEIISFHPVLSKRFKNAEFIDDLKGYGLPLGSKKRVLSGDRFLLVGDAAGLIDPFTGEGIGNALRSGRYAAEHICRCFEKNNFSRKFNREYDQYIYKKMWRELKISRGMQKLLNYPFLFNYVVKKAKNNSSLKKVLVSMLDDADIKEELLSPKFYLKLLFNKY